MPIVAAVLLVLNAVFNIIVWPRFYRQVAKDPRARDASGRATAFLRVHTILIGTALVLAAASLVVGIATLTGAW